MTHRSTRSRLYLLSALLSACASRPVYAQLATVSNTNPYLRMCDGVARPVDTTIAHKPRKTATGPLCWGPPMASIAVPPVDTVRRDSTPTPPPIGGTNEPAGMTRLTEHGFDCLSSCASGWRTQNGYTGAVTLADDPTAPRSPSSVTRQNYTTQLPAGSSPGDAWHESFPLKATVYVAYWFKLGDTFVGNPIENKVLFVPIAYQNRLFTSLRGGTGPFTPRIGLQGLAGSYSAPGIEGSGTVSVNLLPNVSNVPIDRGRWYKYELLLVANTGGLPNGSVTMWVDGVRVLHYAGIPFAGVGEDARWTAAKWSPTYGGRTNPPQSTFWEAMDHIYVSGK